MDGKIALVTGAARGIGAAIARSFVREGADVWLTDIEQDAGERLAAELGVRAAFTRLDVREEPDWSRVMAAVLSEFERLDVVVNNAGITGFEAGAVAQDRRTSLLKTGARFIAPTWMVSSSAANMPCVRCDL
jgi:NAD(P)-dependent dehydrogenase (short-subunit alcohol dehydrogenase family)